MYSIYVYSIKNINIVYVISNIFSIWIQQIALPAGQNILYQNIDNLDKNSEIHLITH